MPALAEIPIEGLGSGTLTPGEYIQVLLGQGVSGAPAAKRGLVIPAPFLSDGTAIANTLYPITSEFQAKTIAGARSPARRAFAEIFAINPRAKAYYLAIPETTGGSPVAADCDFTVTVGATNPIAKGTACIASGPWAAYYQYTTLDTDATIAAGLKTHWNAIDGAAMIASNTGGVGKLVAALKGKSQGDGTTGVHRVRAGCTENTGVSIAFESAALGLTPATAGADGSTTAAAQLATALAAAENVDLYYTAINEWDATALTNLVTNINNKSAPLAGRRCCGFAGFTGTVAAAIALAVAKNNARLEIIAQPKGEREPMVMAAILAALAQKLELTRRNFNSYSEIDFRIPRVVNLADAPSPADVEDAIHGGVTLVNSNDFGAHIVKRCTTKSKNGSDDDTRALEPHGRSIADEFAAKLTIDYRSRFSGWDFEDDEFLEDGTVNPDQEIGYHVLKPSIVRNLVLEEYEVFNDKNNRRLTKIPESIAALECAAHPTLDGVTQLRIPIYRVGINNGMRAQVNELGGR